MDNLALYLLSISTPELPIPLYSNVNTFDIFNYTLPKDTYSCWIYNKDGTANLYLLTDAKELLLFIDICNLYQVDFRDWLVSKPIHYNQEYDAFEELDIEGYDIEPFYKYDGLQQELVYYPDDNLQGNYVAYAF